jgi:hypothetical protein
MEDREGIGDVVQARESAPERGRPFASPAASCQPNQPHIRRDSALRLRSLSAAIAQRIRSRISLVKVSP